MSGATHYLVGEGPNTTLISFGDAGTIIQRYDGLGRGIASRALAGGRPTAAYQRAQYLVVAQGSSLKWFDGSKDSNEYTPDTVSSVSHGITAANIYDLPVSGVASAAFGTRDGGGVVVISPQQDGGTNGTEVAFTCTPGITMFADEILQGPSQGAGFVIGRYFDGGCTGNYPLPATAPGAGHAFVARVPSNSADSFVADMSAPLVLGYRNSLVFTAFRGPAAGGGGVRVIEVMATGPIAGILRINGDLTPVELVEEPSGGYWVVGTTDTNAVVSIPAYAPDGGGARTAVGRDIFVAFIRGDGLAQSLDLIGGPGDQVATGARLVAGPALLISGNCTGGGPFCADAGTNGFIFGLRP